MNDLDMPAFTSSKNHRRAEMLDAESNVPAFERCEDKRGAVHPRTNELEPANSTRTVDPVASQAIIRSPMSTGVALDFHVARRYVVSVRWNFDVPRSANSYWNGTYRERGAQSLFFSGNSTPATLFARVHTSFAQRSDAAGLEVPANCPCCRQAPRGSLRFARLRAQCRTRHHPRGDHSNCDDRPCGRPTPHLCSMPHKT
jgi:hypothetical protein